jgi:hypothetical protein
MMNERIKELWDKAAESTMDHSWESQTKFMERFAELIIKECALVAFKKAGPKTALDVLEHFGVEE